MDPIEAFIVAMIAAIAQAIAHEAVPMIVSALAAPSTAQTGYSDADLQTQIRQAIDNPAQ